MLRIIHINLLKGWGGGENQLLLTRQVLADQNYEQLIVCRHASVLSKKCVEADFSQKSMRKKGLIGLLAAYGFNRVFQAPV